MNRALVVKRKIFVVTLASQIHSNEQSEGAQSEIALPVRGYRTAGPTGSQLVFQTGDPKTMRATAPKNQVNLRAKMQ